jgi:hypothetical protein
MVSSVRLLEPKRNKLLANDENCNFVKIDLTRFNKIPSSAQTRNFQITPVEMHRAAALINLLQLHYFFYMAASIHLKLCRSELA